MGKNKDKDRDISEEEEDNKEEKKDKKEKKEKKEKSKEKVLLKITSLERKLQTLKALSSNDVALTKKYSTTIHGKEIRCDKDVRINVGPIVGKVTSTTAIVLIEVSLSVELIVHLIPEEGSSAGPSYAKQVVPKNRPKGFLIENLSPDTSYHVVIEGVNAKDASRRIGRVKTVATETEIDKTKLKFVTVSCDRPERLRDGETNMWIKLAEEVKNGSVDVVLHLGDQVYGQKEFQDAQAVLRFSGTPRGADAVGSTDKNVLRLHKNIKERIRDIYRFTWNLPGTAYVLSHTSNLMIWSDNDIYNDFTIAKEEHEENLEPIMLYLAHQVYREYQRQLWDLNYEQEKTTDEFHFHRWGSTGVFIHDMRGNRITTKGEQRPDNPILNDAQWNAFTSFIQDPSLKNLIICSEIPYVGDEPETAKELAKKPELEFLKDHWVYSDKELVKLFELVFEWKAADRDGRDVVFVGGDIHVGVTSTIHDAKTNIDIVHLTSTPISNHVCQFFCKLQGKVNERFSYTHVPLLKCRNYGLLEPTYEGGKAHIAAKLVAGEPTGKHRH